LSDFRFKNEVKSGEVRRCFWRKNKCGDAEVELLVRERRSLDILSMKKEARLSARALAEVKVGRGEGNYGVIVCL